MSTTTPPMDIFRYSADFDGTILSTSAFLDKVLPMPSNDFPSSFDVAHKASCSEQNTTLSNKEATLRISQTLQFAQPSGQLTWSQNFSFLLPFPDVPSHSHHEDSDDDDTTLPPFHDISSKVPLPSFDQLTSTEQDPLRVFTDSPSKIHTNSQLSSKEYTRQLPTFVPPNQPAPQPPTHHGARAQRKPRSTPYPEPITLRQPPRGRPTDHSGDFQRTVQLLIYKHKVNAQWHAFRKQRKCTVARAPCVKGYMTFCEMMGGEFESLRDNHRYRNLGSRTECHCPYGSV